ncbi:acetyltransferase [Vibrio sp. OPT18]|uniref:acetyltransferase n=1 Tax=Vibrio sp. OPT18 TaxID=2778641 RepID=UPI001881F654|nr:acetyltransferase [Vibrio sp. OPT18]MBE8578492.1 acetyltransferase [Vibrio sp. OPT18]
MPSIAILGASGHGKVIAEIAELNGYNEIHFFDDRWPDLIHLEHWRVSSDSKFLLANHQQYDAVVIAIGNNAIRLSKHQQLEKCGATLVPLIHPSAVVSKYAVIEAGTVIMANATVNSFTTVGKSSIINTNSSVDHDCKLSDCVHISPGANLAGGVTVGSCSWIGIGAQVKQLVTIGDKVIVGAGSTVINRVPDGKTVVGTPADVI